MATRIAAMMMMMMVMPLLPATARAEGESYRGVLGAWIGGSGQRQDGVAAGSASAALDVTVFPGRRLVDDGTPLSIQAFLQRPHDISVSVGGEYGLAQHDPVGLDPGYRVETATSNLAVAGGGWIGRVYLGAGLRGMRLTQGASSDDPGLAASRYELAVIEPSAQVNVAVHKRFHLGVRYRYGLRLEASQPWSAPSWGAVEVWLRWLTAGQRVHGTGTLFTLDRGGYGVAATVEGFVTTRLGLFGGITAENGLIFVNSTGPYERWAINAGAGIWVTRRVELVPSLTVYGTQSLERLFVVPPRQGFGSLAPIVWAASLGVALSWRF